MIRLDGAAQREVTFAATAETALSYFGNLSQVIHFLPHIQVIEEYSPNQVRVCYSTVELGAYSINIFTDLECVIDRPNCSISIRPFKSRHPVAGEAGLNTTMGYGYFVSTAYLENTVGGTYIDFRLKMSASLPRPQGLRMMPTRAVNRIVSSISQGRVNEIIDGFLANATAAFPAWLAAQELAAG